MELSVELLDKVCHIDDPVGAVSVHGVRRLPDLHHAVAVYTRRKTMKLIIAYIQPHKLNEVKQELFKEQIYKMSVTNALGCGRQKGYHESYRGVDIEVNLLKKVRLEIAVNGDFVRRTVDAIVRGARSGEIGDGKIFILELRECIRIRSGQTGSVAIG